MSLVSVCNVTRAVALQDRAGPTRGGSVVTAVTTTAPAHETDTGVRESYTYSSLPLVDIGSM